VVGGSGVWRSLYAVRLLSSHICFSAWRSRVRAFLLPTTRRLTKLSDTRDIRRRSHHNEDFGGDVINSCVMPVKVIVPP
jgi:hypothetical protein